MSHARLRIYDDGLCCTPRSVTLLCTKEVEKEGIEESSVAITFRIVPQCIMCRIAYFLSTNMSRKRTRHPPTLIGSPNHDQYTT
jgi:hypothetical protein